MTKLMRSFGTAIPVRSKGDQEGKFGNRAFLGVGMRRSSDVAQTMKGHRSWQGSPSNRIGTKTPTSPSHRRWFGSPTPTPPTNRMDEIVPLVLAERDRQALYEACERAPEFTQKHRNLAAPY